VCLRCEVRENCLAWAMEAREDYGVLGGLSESERRELRRSLRTPPGVSGESR
ncbi:MAG: transcription factor WhiB, partial [Marmoricola sp.]|nr:transcription factor WhiB [Marmoricola sp.]